MGRLIGINLLIIDTDRDYAASFVKTMQEAGANCEAAFTIEEAKNSFANFDHELVVCHHSLSDGSILDFVNWAKLSLKFPPVFLSLGAPLPGAEVILLGNSISEILQERSEPETLIDIIYKHLNKVSDFMSADCFSSFIDPKAIESFLYIDKNKVPVTVLELMPDGIVLTCEEEMPQGTQGMVRLSIYEHGNFQNFMAIVSYEKADGEAKTLKVAEIHQRAWNKFVKAIESKQERFTAFLKKASGL